MKTIALDMSSHLQQLAICPETLELVGSRDVEGFTALCNRLLIPPYYVESLRSTVFPPIVNSGWPTEPQKRED